MIKGPASLVAMWLILSSTRSLLWTTAGLFLVWTGILLTYDTTYARRLVKLQPPLPLMRPARLILLRRLAWLALPLGVVGLLDSLNVNVPRYLIEHRLGEAALGHFAALAYIVVAGNMVVAALAHSAAPRLSREFVTHRAAFRHLAWRLVAFGGVLGGAGVLIALLFGHRLLLLLYRPEYAAHTEVFTWLMVAAAFGYIARFVVVAASAARSFRAQAPLYAVSLAIVAACSWWMIPRWGLLGAAWAVATAAAALLVGAVVVLFAALRRPVVTEAELNPDVLGPTDGS
jgi:O-antigen/teichoic acid export membrane protein